MWENGEIWQTEGRSIKGEGQFSRRENEKKALESQFCHSQLLDDGVSIQETVFNVLVIGLNSLCKGQNCYLLMGS